MELRKSYPEFDAGRDEIVGDKIKNVLEREEDKIFSIANEASKITEIEGTMGKKKKNLSKLQRERKQ